jgi:hypothetical protein
MRNSPLARLRPPALSERTHRHRAASPNPAQAVLSEAALTHKIVGTKVSEAEFALAGGACAWGGADALGVGSGGAAGRAGGARCGADSGEVALAELWPCGRCS